MQMLLADMMVYPVYAALQGSEEPLHGVRCDAKTILIPHIFIGLMIHLIVSTTHQSAVISYFFSTARELSM